MSGQKNNLSNEFKLESIITYLLRFDMSYQQQQKNLKFIKKIS